MKSKGFSQIFILLLLVILIIFASAASYYILKASGKAPKQGLIKTLIPSSQISTTPTPSDVVSDSDEVETIESELENTDIGSPDADIKELETSASSL